MPADAPDSGLPRPGPWLQARMRPHRHWLLGATAAGLGATLATVALAGLIAWAVHMALFAPERLPLGMVLAGAAVAAVLRYALQALRDGAGHRLADAVKRELREELLDAARRDGAVHLAHRAPSGAWVDHYLRRVEDLTGHYARYLPGTRMVILTPLVLLLTVAWLDWLAAGLLLLSAPLIPAFMALVGMGAEQIHRRQQDEENRLAGHFLDRLRSLDFLRRARATQAAREAVVAASDEHRRLTMRVLRVAFLSSAIMEFFSAVAIGLLAIYIGFGLFGAIDYGPAGSLTLFTGLFILVLAPEYFLPLRQFAQSYHDRAAALAAAESLAPLLQPAGGPATAPPGAPDSPRTAVHLAGVQVQYPDTAQPALHDIDLQIGRGEHLAVTGPSGSGKSTLLALLAGFLRPASGEIRMADDLQRFVWIGQDAHLFHGSLRDNLQLASAEPVSDAAMHDALARAGLPVDDPQLPDGLDTAIGEGNTGISGGQAQRIAMARGILAGHPLWLLDEPTSALDEATEAALLDTLFALAAEHDITLVIAAHREAVRERASRVVRLADGRVESLA
ncbi:thiol reductant ABC exporter subunit CydD [Thioalkalivibrio sp. ALE23]|uniref:thiol reductant ABC exporter subunit CydD n=1 Tax=Thioalkalivibrio sp. ALE23 TaxID=1265495 RepID=UPI0003769365|nr:thiol reductant ABC exporter subunit CydD [Thioalkalivibrio sp. ALE23]